MMLHAIRRLVNPVGDEGPKDTRSGAVAVTATALLGCMMLLPASTAAQERPVPAEPIQPRAETPTVKFDARAGAAFPAGDLADVADPGFTAGLGVGFFLSPRVVLRLDGDMSRLSDLNGNDFQQDVGDFFEGNLNLWHYNGGVEFNLVDPRTRNFDVLLSLGAGATTIDPNQPADPELEAFGTRTRFTANGSIGFGTRLGDNVGIQLRGTTYAIFLNDDDFLSGDLEEATRDMWWSFPVQLGVGIALP